MKPRKVLAFGAIAVVMVIIFYSFGGKNTLDHGEMISVHRAEVDQFMRSSESPLPDSLLEDFSGLSYYSYDEDYRVEAQLDKLSGEQTISLGTSDGKVKNYLKYALANFELKGKALSLVLLQSMEDDEGDYLFIPFIDLTSGETSYGGGRYLDLEIPTGNDIIIDFNLSYNPYCAYNAAYSCPLPPSENRLAIGIFAGERKFE